MQWVFVVAGLVAVLAEMHTGTFYLAAVAAAAILTAGLGYWIDGEWLVYAFAVLCVAFMVPVSFLRRHRKRDRDALDFDVGQTVSVLAVAQPGNRLTVSYRGTQWDAAMDDGSAAAPGDTLVIARKTDKHLHLVPRA